MGFRFRKSVNLGGGFRINFSKSGVGYSFGGKGFRYTKTRAERTGQHYLYPEPAFRGWRKTGNQRNRQIQ